MKFRFSAGLAAINGVKGLSFSFVSRAWRFVPKSISLCMAALWLGCVVTQTFAAVKVWVAEEGFDNNLWSDPANWDPPGVPHSGDAVVLSSSGELSDRRHTLMVNDVVGLVINSLLFCGTSDSSVHPMWTLEGNELTLGNEITRTNQCGFGGLIINCPLKLDSGVRMTMGWGRIFLRGNIDLNGHDLTLDSGDQIIVTGQITGTGNVLAIIDGSVRGASITFDGPAGNTFRGRLTVRHLYSDIGQVIFDKESGAVVNDSLLIGNGRETLTSRGWPICKLARSHQIGDNAEVLITGGGQLLLDGHTETIGSLSLTNFGRDTIPCLVDTGGSTLSVLGSITAVNDATNVVPIIRGKLGLPGASINSTETKQ